MNKTSDKQETPRTDALANQWSHGWRDLRDAANAYNPMVLLARQLERELAMMTEAHETCKRCFAEAERALSARGATSTFSERDEEEFFLRAQHRNLRKQIEAIVRAHDALVHETSKDNAFALKRTIDQARSIGLTDEERAVSTEEYEDACDENFRRDLKTQYVNCQSPNEKK